MFKPSSSFGRDRRYPVLTAIDLFCYFALSGAVLACVVTTVGLVMARLAPDFTAQIILFAQKLVGSI